MDLSFPTRGSSYWTREDYANQPAATRRDSEANRGVHGLDVPPIFQDHTEVNSFPFLIITDRYMGDLAVCLRLGLGFKMKI